MQIRIQHFHCGSGFSSGSRVLMTKNWKNFTVEKKITCIFLIIFALLNPEPATQINGSGSTALNIIFWEKTVWCSSASRLVIETFVQVEVENFSPFYCFTQSHPSHKEKKKTQNKYYTSDNGRTRKDNERSGAVTARKNTFLYTELVLRCYSSTFLIENCTIKKNCFTEDTAYWNNSAKSANQSISCSKGHWK
jgi:hypothetical protein